MRGEERHEYPLIKNAAGSQIAALSENQREIGLINSSATACLVRNITRSRRTHVNFTHLTDL